MTKLNTNDFAKTLTAMGFEVKFESNGVMDAKMMTCKGELQVLAYGTDVHVWKPNGAFKAYAEPTTAQAVARVRQTVKANGGKADQWVPEVVEPEVETSEPEAEATEATAKVTKVIASSDDGYKFEIERADWSIRVYSFETRRHATRRVWFSVHSAMMYVQYAGKFWSVCTEMDGRYAPWLVIDYVEVAPENRATDATITETTTDERREASATGEATTVRAAFDACDGRVFADVREIEDAGAEEGFEFAELTPEQAEYVENAGAVTHGSIPEQVARVADELGLRGLSPEGVTAVRNAVVRHLGDLMAEARDAGDWAAFDRLSANMGGVCEAIDRTLADAGEAPTGVAADAVRRPAKSVGAGRVPKHVIRKIDRMNRLMQQVVDLNLELEAWIEASTGGRVSGYDLTLGYRDDRGYGIILPDAFVDELSRVIGGEGVM